MLLLINNESIEIPCEGYELLEDKCVYKINNKYCDKYCKYFIPQDDFCENLCNMGGD